MHEGEKVGRREEIGNQGYGKEMIGTWRKTYKGWSGTGQSLCLHWAFLLMIEDTTYFCGPGRSPKISVLASALPANPRVGVGSSLSSLTRQAPSL